MSVGVRVRACPLACFAASVRAFACRVRVRPRSACASPVRQPLGAFVCLFVFRAGVMERFGACMYVVSDDLVGLVRELCGGGDRDSVEDDWSAAPKTQFPYHMQRVVFAGVMADAEMVERALDMDVFCMRPEAGRGDAATRRGAGRVAG